MTHKLPTPVHHYRFGTEAPLEGTIQGSEIRVIEHDSRRGIHLPSIRGRFILPEHTVNESQGTLTMWVMPLQDLYPCPHYPEHAHSNPNYDRYVFLTDREHLSDVNAAQFAVFFASRWHPGLMAKFHEGNNLYWQAEQGAAATSGHFEMKSLHWYQMTVTWDRPKGLYAVYLNGVLIATHDTSEPTALPNQPCSPLLYGGNPSLVYSDIVFFDKILSPDEVRESFYAQAGTVDSALQEHLEKVFAGKGLEPFQWRPDESWSESLSVPMNRQEDLLAFYHQGAAIGTTVTPEGMRVTTPSMEDYYKFHKRRAAEETRIGHHPVNADTTRMYLWTRQEFEGDIHASFDFQILQHGGLCLFMAQASGMQGEDFMQDYFLRTDGAMRMVYLEDVRNYHWEFYREMRDTRNDLVSHACLKNPWHKPVSFQIEDRNWELKRWYRFEFLQEGNRIRGAIDGVTVMDAIDNGFDNNGPVLRKGHIAIRCMMRTDMLFRNLRVLNRPDFKVLPPPLQ